MRQRRKKLQTIKNKQEKVPLLLLFPATQYPLSHYQILRLLLLARTGLHRPLAPYMQHSVQRARASIPDHEAHCEACTDGLSRKY